MTSFTGFIKFFKGCSFGVARFVSLRRVTNKLNGCNISSSSRDFKILNFLSACCDLITDVI